MTQTIKLMLDKARRDVSTVHGERAPDDAHYGVAYFLDDLPFDAAGKLIEPPEDALKKQPWVTQSESDDGKIVNIKQFPLWTAKRLEILKRKLDRLSKNAPPEEVVEGDNPEDIENAAEEVNLLMWLQGKQNYDWFLLRAACKKRMGANHATKKGMVQALVYDEKVCTEDEVCPALKQYLLQPVAA